jgi:hypothetical protein
MRSVQRTRSIGRFALERPVSAATAVLLFALGLLSVAGADIGRYVGLRPEWVRPLLIAGGLIQPVLFFCLWRAVVALQVLVLLLALGRSFLVAVEFYPAPIPLLVSLSLAVVSVLLVREYTR